MKKHSKLRRFGAIILAMAMVLTLITPSITSDAATSKTGKVTAVKVTNLPSGTLTLKKGKSKTLKVSVSTSNSKVSKKVVFKSSNTKVATVSSKGKITAKKNGTTKITVSSKVNAKKKTVITVKVGTPVTKVTLNKKNAKITQGKKLKLKATLTPKKASNKKVIWKSSNKKIAKVSSNGTVTAVKKGSATITATAADGSGKKASCKITVTAKSQKPATVNPTPVNPTPVNPTPVNPTPVAPTPVIANKLTLSDTAITIKKDEEKQLTASLEPSNVTDSSLTWSSSNTSVVQVSEAGMVRGLKKGTAVVTVRNTASGLSASCNVTIIYSAVVSSQEELDSALADGVNSLTLNISEDQDITIPSGSYSDVALSVNRNGGTITNNGNFDAIEITAPINYIENARNTLILTAPASIAISKNASASIMINLANAVKDDTVFVHNEGTISQLDIMSAGTIRLTNEKERTTPLPVNITSDNVKFVTDQPAAITANKKADLVFTGETEGTSISVDTAANTPDIFGVGYFDVISKDTDKKETISARPSAEVAKVTIIGNVQSATTDAALSDVTVTLIPEVDYKEGTIPETAVTISTDDDGDYSFSQVPGGNYYLVMTAKGYKPAIQLLSASSRYNSVYQNETMEMIPSDLEDNNTGSISGTILDASNKNAVAELTIEIRKNKGNVLGDALQTVTANSDGSFQFDGLTGDQYTIHVIDNTDSSERYITKNMNVCLLPDDTLTNQTITVTKPIKGSGIRFVLSWGSEEDGVPSDLDSHLFGPSINDPDGVSEVYYDDAIYASGMRIFTILDVDETSYSGPETSTIVTPIDGMYYFYVYQYSENGSLTASKASVDVYSGGELLTTYNVPTSYTSDNTDTEDENSTSSPRWWKVCSYDSRTNDITSLNELCTSVIINDKLIDTSGYGDNDADHGYTFGPTPSVSCDSDPNFQYSISQPSVDTVTDSSTFGTITNGTITIYPNIYDETNIWDHLTWNIAEGYTCTVSDDHKTLKVYDTKNVLWGTYDLIVAEMLIPALDDSYDYTVEFDSREIYVNMYTLPTEENVVALPFKIPNKAGYTCSVEYDYTGSLATYAYVSVYNETGKCECTFDLIVYFKLYSEISCVEPLDSYSIDSRDLELYWSRGDIYVDDLDAATITKSLNITLYKPDLYTYTIEKAQEENDDGELVDNDYFVLKFIEKESQTTVKQYTIYNSYSTAPDDGNDGDYGDE